MLQFGYGIDLAEDLNYASIICLELTNKIRFAKTGAIRKFKDIHYPDLQNLLLNDLFHKNFPTYCCVDYTSEKSFSEQLEAALNPLFLAVNTPHHYKWRYVEPVKFTQDSKLAMKQNSRRFMEGDDPIFKWPEKEECDPRTWALIEELKEQLQREAASPSQSGKWSFLKPEGFDNDLAIGFELALWGARNKYKPQASFSSQRPIIKSGSFSNYSESMTKEELVHENMKKRFAKFGGFEVTDVKVDLPK